jgi:hypothetical protein
LEKHSCREQAACLTSTEETMPVKGARGEDVTPLRLAVDQLQMAAEKCRSLPPRDAVRPGWDFGSFSQLVAFSARRLPCKTSTTCGLIQTVSPHNRQLSCIVWKACRAFKVIPRHNVKHYLLQLAKSPQPAQSKLSVHLQDPRETPNCSPLPLPLSHLLSSRFVSTSRSPRRRCNVRGYLKYGTDL